MNTRLFHGAKATGFAAAVLAVFLSTAAQAIPPNQFDVDEATIVSATSLTQFELANLTVTVNNDVARHCVIQFSAEARNTQAGDGVGVGLAIDGGVRACSASFGPNLFHFAERGTPDAVETHTAVFVRRIPAGTHTIRACFRLLNLNPTPVEFQTADLLDRILTVECRTR